MNKLLEERQANIAKIEEVHQEIYDTLKDYEDQMNMVEDCFGSFGQKFLARMRIANYIDKNLDDLEKDYFNITSCDGSNLIFFLGTSTQNFQGFTLRNEPTDTKKLKKNECVDCFYSYDFGQLISFSRQWNVEPQHKVLDGEIDISKFMTNDFFTLSYDKNFSASEIKTQIDAFVNEQIAKNDFKSWQLLRTFLRTQISQLSAIDFEQNLSGENATSIHPQISEQ